MKRMTGGQAIVEVLRAEGVKFVFGLPGGHTLGLYDALYDARDIRHVLVRHEQVAANMAGAYAQLTGEVGVCTATAGPGVTNIVSGIAEAHVGALPVVAIAGRGHTRTTFRGAAQELPQDKMFAPITKWAVRVDRVDLLVEVMRQAFTIARSGKPGPVLVDVPIDVMLDSVDFDGYVPVGKPPAPRPEAAVIGAVAEQLLASERPIVVAGGGAVAAGANAELVRLAEMRGLPVLTTLSGRGSFPDDHPLAGGGLGMHRTDVSKKLLAEADFVLGLGCRFEEFETNWKPGYVPRPDACYVQVDTDPVELGKSVVPQIPVLGDARVTLQDLIDALETKGAPDHSRELDTLPRVRLLAEEKRHLEESLRASATSNGVPLHPVRVLAELRATFPRETTLAVEIGAITQGYSGAYPYFQVYEPRSVMVCTSFYAMGFVSSALPIARLVYPDRPAICVGGDGSFQMIMHVLPVAAELELGVTWCVFNNNALGSIRDLQTVVFGGRHIATSFGVQPDFARIAEACSCYGERVERPEEITPAAQRALEANTRGIPAVLDFAVADEPSQASGEYFMGS